MRLHWTTAWMIAGAALLAAVLLQPSDADVAEARIAEIDSFIRLLISAKSKTTDEAAVQEFNAALMAAILERTEINLRRHP